MKIGCPKEIKPQEFRVGMTPNAAREAVNRGHQVMAARTLDEAVAHLSQQSIDCLVVKLRLAWTEPLEIFLRGLATGTVSPRPQVVAVVLDDPPPRPAEWLTRGVDDIVMGLSRGHDLDLRLAVVEKRLALMPLLVGGFALVFGDQAGVSEVCSQQQVAVRGVGFKRAGRLDQTPHGGKVFGQVGAGNTRDLGRLKERGQELWVSLRQGLARRCCWRSRC